MDINIFLDISKLLLTFVILDVYGLHTYLSISHGKFHTKCIRTSYMCMYMTACKRRFICLETVFLHGTYKSLLKLNTMLYFHSIFNTFTNNDNIWKNMFRCIFVL